MFPGAGGYFIAGGADKGVTLSEGRIVCLMAPVMPRQIPRCAKDDGVTRPFAMELSGQRDRFNCGR